MLEFSRGYEAVVYFVSAEERQQFPNADLVRVQISPDRGLACYRELQHRIACMVYPNNFLPYIGSITEPLPPCGYGFTHRLYSKEIPVDGGHAVYAAHMGVDDGVKVFLCTCLTCSEHKRTHGSARFVSELLWARTEMPRTGVVPPTDDPSDYCLKSNGEIIFFEVMDIEPDVLRKYLAWKNPENRAGVELTLRKYENLAF